MTDNCGWLRETEAEDRKDGAEKKEMGGKGRQRRIEGTGWEGGGIQGYYRGD